MLLLLLIALLTGMGVPLQTAANARVRLAAGSLTATVLISFSVSLVVLLLISQILGAPVLPSAAQFAAVPLWAWSGGIIALFTIAASTFLFKMLGQLQTTVLPLLGQLSFSLVIDHFGLFGSMQIPLTGTRLAAMALILAGVALAVVLPNLKQQRTDNAGKLMWQITGVAAGCLMASIGAVYGRLGTLLGSAVQASTLSFLLAVFAIGIFCLAAGSIKNTAAVFKAKLPWWAWLGGICGAVSVFANALLIPSLGAGTFFTAMLLGQMLLSLVMEARGWLGAPKKIIAPVQFAGIALMFAGVALIRV